MNEKNSTEELNTYARLAMPLMYKHGVAVTPRNYTVWYDYVSGNNDELRKAIDNIIEKGRKFSDETNEILYSRFCSEKDENELRKLREDLQQVLVTIFSEVAKLSGQTEKYETLVSKSVEELSEDTSIEKIRSVVSEIIVETKSIGTFGKEMQNKLKETTEELDILQNELEQAKAEATADFLTGVANRKAFDETLAMCANEATSDNYDLCLLMIDIDHFKQFNDVHGHQIGDEVLKFVAKKIKKTVKGRDFLARFGGEEFAVILQQTPLAGAKIVAENIRSFFAKKKLRTVLTLKKLGMITVSIGSARYRHGEPLENFIKRSDQALYLAKNAGRNRVATETDL